MVYEARPGQVFLLGRLLLADRGDRARPRDRHAGARGARGGPLLEGRRHRTPEGARRGDRRVRALGGGPAPPRCSSASTTSTRGRRATWWSSCASSRQATRRAAERPHDRGRALPRRDRRLAAVRALALRRAHPRRLGARAVGADPRAPRPRGRRDLVRRRDHRAPPRDRRARRRRRARARR